MAGVFGVDQLKKGAVDCAKIANVISKVIHKAGIFALLEAVGPIKDLAALDYNQFKKEVSELDGEDRKQVEDAFKAELSLQDPLIQSKVVGLVGALDKAVELVGRALSVYSDAKSLVEEVKALFQVQPV